MTLKKQFKWAGLTLFVLATVSSSNGQLMNRAPQFVPGTGDMARFSLSENTPVGSPVYQLQGTDPEGSQLGYSISGPVFTVDRDTGVVRLRQSLDRETNDLIEVIISITDEGVLGTEPNTVSLRREIPIRDYNDNPPIFHGRPYTAKVSESSLLGSVIEVHPSIIVTDRDEGVNAEITLSCYHDDLKDNSVCETFHISTEKLADGNYSADITLLKQLDFETRPSYILTLMAKDGSSEKPLSALATISINVLDVQDQPPIFLNAPYSISLQENTEEGVSVLEIRATDGDTGSPRPILLTIENEAFGYFALTQIQSEPGIAKLTTTNVTIDRENPDILQNGGVYTFTVKATELINNELPADFSTTQVTVVVTDVDDHLAEFNAPTFEISIPENLEYNTPLPGLSIYVTDKDLGANSRYNLSLRNVLNADNVFVVSPLSGEGRTPIVVKVSDPTKLDYDVSDENLRTIIFDLVATAGDREQSATQVTVHLLDANDNAPVFEQTNYHLGVEENAKIGLMIADISATDKDSGRFGQITYMLKGFGADNFETNETQGRIYVKRNLDYEEQKSYSLTLVAVDGGFQETNANLFIEVIDLNDNAPEFESLEYTRTIREGVLEFEPQFFVRATDRDGSAQGGSNLTYNIESENSIAGNIFGIDRQTGEIRITKPVSSMHTERGEYELSVSATDHGVPALSNTTRVLIRVGVSGNQRPIFKGQFVGFENGNIPGPPSYRVSIPENSEPGYNVTTVTATDPDGIDALLTYRIVSGHDNFVMDERSGLVQVAPHARLDRDHNPSHYAVVINAVDAGFPIPETATTTLNINVQDVNDKPPKFEQSSYTAYISERSQMGEDVVEVKARDSDESSKIKYSIIEPIRAASKTGANLIGTSSYNFKDAFQINEDTGILTVKNPLVHDYAAVVILTVQAVDANAEFNIESQKTTAEVTIYIQSFKDTNPVFRNKGWNSLKSVINVNIKEELPIGSTLFTLMADDPVLERPIQSFQLVKDDELGAFSLNDRTGDISLKKRLDYEVLLKPFIDFDVKARTSDGQRETIVKVNVTIENVNDNGPEFEMMTYKANISEAAKYPTNILKVSATDKDAELTELDKRIGYSSVSYSLSSSSSNLFGINNITGEISLMPNKTLDREAQSVIILKVIAEDSVGRRMDSKKSIAEVLINVLDINDNAPLFSQKYYSAVIPENVPANTFVFKINATDPDEGPGGQIRFDLLNEGDANGLLKINRTSGEIRTKVSLTGKGRSDPYDIIIRAQDNGNQLPKQQSLHSDVQFKLYIGDVSANDGTPFFIAPKIGQTANVSENATIGSPVFQVVASDPDSPATASGTLRFNIQDGVRDAEVFMIDSQTGLITNVRQLDRETQDSYNIILEVSDNGQPPQAATRVLHINVLDIDDHKPRFIRDVDAQPLEFSIKEEEPAGTIVAMLQAIDEDIGDNSDIDYIISDGNQENLFMIQRTENNSAIIKTTEKLDRELLESFHLTIKCFKNGIDQHLISRSTYNKYDLSEVQVIINLLDIDDHLPQFDNKDQAVGVRLNVPIDTTIAIVRAYDKDPEALKIAYHLQNVTFVPQFYKRAGVPFEKLKDIFSLNNITGEIKTTHSLSDYVDGYFDVTVRANNSMDAERFSDNKLKVYVIRDKSLLKFVFTKPPSEVRGVVKVFAEKVQKYLQPSNLELNIFDTQVLTKSDHSLDFSATSSCFQLSRHGAALSPNEMQKVMDNPDLRHALLETYANFSVSRIESCSVKRTIAAASIMSSAGTWLVILAALIGIGSLIATCTVCCLARKYKRQSKRMAAPRLPPESFAVGPSVLYSEPIYGPL